MKKYLLIIVGCISLGLGVIGMFLPVLPTTPFLLLSAGCFLRSSKSLYDWLLNHKHLGGYIRDFIEHKAISKNCLPNHFIKWAKCTISLRNTTIICRDNFNNLQYLL